MEGFSDCTFGLPYYDSPTKLQIILKILRNLGNQVGAVATMYVVVVAGIDEIVELLAVVDAVLYKD